MKKIKIWLVFAAILTILALPSCRSKEVILENYSERTVEVVKIDTVVVVEGGRISEITPISLLHHGFVHKVEHELADVHITIDTLKNALRTDIIVHNQEVIVQGEKTTVTDREFTREETTKKPPQRIAWWVWLLIGMIIGSILTWRLR